MVLQRLSQEMASGFPVNPCLAALGSVSGICLFIQLV